MRRKEPIKNIMSTDPYTVQKGEPLSHVRQLLVEHSYLHHVPILDGKRLVGILSSTDLAALSLEAYGTDPRLSDNLLDTRFKVEGVMHQPIYLSKDETVRDAARLLNTGRFHSLPVVDNETDRNLVGIVTSTDLVRFLNGVLSNK